MFFMLDCYQQPWFGLCISSRNIDLIACKLLLNMVTIVVGTNRINSKSGKVAAFYNTRISMLGAESQILDLSELPADFTASALYHNSGNNEKLNHLRLEMEQAQK